MKTKILTLSLFILLLTKISYSQENGMYAKASASIAYPCPTFIGSVGYGFNKHFAVGVGVGVLSPAFYDICFPLSLEISGDITKNNIIGNAALCYSIEPMILPGTNLYYVLPKIGLRNDNCHFYLTVMGVNFGYRFGFKTTRPQVYRY